jgi:hypothetical protein
VAVLCDRLRIAPGLRWVRPSAKAQLHRYALIRNIQGGSRRTQLLCGQSEGGNFLPVDNTAVYLNYWFALLSEVEYACSFSRKTDFVNIHFPWKRFWCRREASFSLADHGFLADPEGEHSGILNPELATLDQLQTVSCLALLGEPGVGKSRSLSDDLDAFLKEKPALEMIRLDLRSFGSEERLYRALFENPKFLHWKDGDGELHVYLDSFDECLLRIDTVAAMLADELPKYPLKRLKLRIACRTAAWPPLLENALKRGYGEDHFAASELVPLRRVDALEAASLVGIVEPEAFLCRVDDLGLSALASKPVTLKFLLDTFLRESDLPADLMTVYEKGCLILCEEQNENRLAARRTGILSPESRLEVASRIAAVTQLGNHFAVWTGTEAGGVPAEDITISQIAGGTETAEQIINVSYEMIEDTLDTGLFSSRGEERLGWSHQTLAEYLAARYCLTHGLSIEQLRSLIFHPRRPRVVPQVREVASWLALQNVELFLEIAEKDPEVLLGSAAPSLSPCQRRELTDALLRSCDQSEILHIHHNLATRHLAHPGLAAQLEPVLREKSRSVSTRYFAIRVARSCSVEGLGEVLGNIALSDEETHDLRSAAAYGVAELGSASERERMRPLLTATREIDPNDQLRGAALNAIYPGNVYDDTMWSYLEHPRQALYGGAYSSFYYFSVIPKLNAQNLPAALEWCRQQPVEDIGPVVDLEEKIFALAVELIEAPNVAESLANAVFHRCKSYRGFPGKGHRQKQSSEQVLWGDAERRRTFLSAFIPLLNPENTHTLMHPLSLLVRDDLEWYIERIKTGVSPNPVVEARIVCRLACSWKLDVLTTVWHACQENTVIDAECKSLFEPVPLDSELAKWERESSEDFLKKNNIERAPAMTPRVEASLMRSESGDVDEWCRLMAEMSLEEGGTHYQHLRTMKVLDLPGWLEAPEETRLRIVEAAKRYLLGSTFPELDSTPSNQVRNGASAAINALWLIQAMEPKFLQKQPSEFWEQWIPSFTEDGRAGDDKVPEIEEAFRLAALSAPDAINQRLLTLIEVQNASEQKVLFHSALFDRAWSESLGKLLFQRVRQCDLAISIQGSLLSMLLLNEIDGVRAWAEEIVRTQHQTELGIKFSQVLLGAGEEQAWHVLWPIITTDTNFGRELLEGFSYGRPDRTSFGAGFTESELEDLYGWMIEQYPPTNDRLVSGAVGPIDTIRFLRDGILEVLKKRGTFEACDAIAHVELRLPQHKWLRYHFDEAEVLACAMTWEPPSPDVILAMGADSDKRFVESNEQLLDVTVESLNRLQAELHGELGSVVDLWNNHDREWWPIQEEDISDYITRFLRRDLSERGIVLNREVQIRRGRRAEMPGQNTDIHVDAVLPDQAAKSPYGQVTVIIEVKGTWNDGLMSDMEGQLRGRYLRNSGCRTGLYLAAHFVAASWRASDTRKAKSERWNVDTLRVRLGEQASALSGSVTIRSFVLDASLDSSAASVLEEHRR